MNQEQSIKSRAVPGGNQIRVRLDQFKQSRGLGQVGAAELAGMAAAVLLLLVTVFVYFYLLLPARARRDSAQLDRQRLQGQLRAAQGEVVLNTNTKETVDKINASLEDFEGNDLAPTSSGRMSLYAELNNLIRSNGLRDTAGPTYTTLDPHKATITGACRSRKTGQRQVAERLSRHCRFGDRGRPLPECAALCAGPRD